MKCDRLLECVFVVAGEIYSVFNEEYTVATRVAQRNTLLLRGDIILDVSPYIL